LALEKSKVTLAEEQHDEKVGREKADAKGDAYSVGIQLQEA